MCMILKLCFKKVNMIFQLSCTLYFQKGKYEQKIGFFLGGGGSAILPIFVALGKDIYIE